MSLQERCAYHKSGHAVAALTFGIPIITVKLKTTGRTCTAGVIMCRMQTLGWKAW
jgi:hypothetical protein